MRTDKGNILPVTVRKNPRSKTDSNWVFDGLKETHRSIQKMAIYRGFEGGGRQNLMSLVAHTQAELHIWSPFKFESYLF